MAQQAIQDKYGVFTTATSTGQSIWFKYPDYEKLKNILPISSVQGRYYMMMINKTTLKKLNLI